MRAVDPHPRPGDPSAADIAACRKGDRDALERVLRSNVPVIEKLLARMIGPGADLEDLLQATLMATVAAFPRYRGEASVRTWMSHIAVNIVRQHLRRPEQRRRVALELVPDQRPNQAPDPNRAADHRAGLERLFHHLAKISIKKRLAFVLHVVEGYPMDEVAALTNASVSATKSRVFWARRALLASARRDPLLRDLMNIEVGP